MIGKRTMWKRLTLVAFVAVLMLGVFSSTPHMITYGRVADLPQADNTSSVNGLPSQWHLAKIMADKAWQITDSTPDIVVAVLDTGIDVNNEDLLGKVKQSVNFTSSPTEDDVYGHGTLIASLIAASEQDLQGATGVAYNCSLLNVKVADDAGFTTPEAVAEGIIWAADNGADIINMSVVLTSPSTAVEDAVNYAWGKGCLLVAASGNNAGLKPMYPAAYENVISVGATDQNDQLARWSNRGEWVTVSAPGVDIYSTAQDDKYVQKSGTSFATALVSGEAALLYAVVTDKNGNGYINDEVSEIIQSSTDATVNADAKGRINVLKAVDAALANQP